MNPVFYEGVEMTEYTPDDVGRNLICFGYLGAWISWRIKQSSVFRGLKVSPLDHAVQDSSREVNPAMEDDELTQEVLEQFDLLCTQYQLEHGNNVTAPTKTVWSFHDAVLNQTNSVNIAVTNDGAGDGKRRPSGLMRTTSLGPRGSGLDSSEFKSIPHQNTEFPNSELENEKLKKEVSALREELYMRLGELATIKEAASRSSASNSDTIMRLETSLTSEREQFHRKLSEVNAQLAFRESDYRLVASELARVKELLSTRKPAASQEPNPEFSPASQLIVSVVASPHDASKRSPVPQSRGENPNPTLDFHLPAPVTPLPNRRSSHMNGTWKVPSMVRNGAADVAKPSALGDNKSGCSVVNVGTRTRSFFDEEMMDFGTPKKRQRRSTCDCTPLSPGLSGVDTRESRTVKLMADASVETDKILYASVDSQSSLPLRVHAPMSDSNTRKRSRILPSSCNILSPTTLASQLLNLTILDDTDAVHVGSSLPSANTRNGIKPHSEVIPMQLLAQMAPDPVSLDSDQFLVGLNELLSFKENNQSTNQTSQMVSLVLDNLSKSIPRLLRRIRRQLKISLTAIRSSIRRSDVTPATTFAVPAETEDEQPDPGSLQVHVVSDLDELGVSYLGEDPFAGAPASQIVGPPIRVSPVRRDNGFPAYSDSLGRGGFGSHTAPNYALSTPKGSLFSSQEQQVLQQGVLAFRQLHCIIGVLRSLHNVLNDVRSSACVDNQWTNERACKSSSENPVEWNLPAHVQLSRLFISIGEISFEFITGLVDICMDLTCETDDRNPVNEESHQSIHRTVSLLSTTQSQLPCENKGFGAGASVSGHTVSSLNPCFLFALVIFSVLAMDLNSWLVTYVLTPKSDDVPLNNSHSHEILQPEKNRPPDFRSQYFTDSLILASGTARLICEMGKISDELVQQLRTVFVSTPTDSCFGLGPVITFLRLSSFMVSAGCWNLGHKSGKWWDPGAGPEFHQDTKVELKVDQDNRSVRVQYLHSLFGDSASCQLLSIVSWVRDEVELCLRLGKENRQQIEFPSGFDWDLQSAELLEEFSKFITALVGRTDTDWPDACPCKAQVYSTLVYLAGPPLDGLLTLPVTLNCENGLSSDMLYMTKQAIYLTAFGHLTQALISLLWRHGDGYFQTYTDCLPSYFWLISNLSKWIQRSRRFLERPPSPTAWDSVLTPELVEELYDFDSGGECGAKTEG
ncbi:unnamed protein product [Calicophoron daubneyi]|uniref:Uncharacterized protein n=1 Tax=Calicophoron daubneyi TaxID=300641 RepID=A0AAV2SZT9_CALDB